jgi:hypothetical protein
MTELENNIINDYPSIGAKLCSIKYKTPYNKVMWIREKYSLTIDKELYTPIRKQIYANSTRKKTIHNIDEKNFMVNFTKESVYMLGFIWGDGYIAHLNNNNQIRIECISDDINQLKNTINCTGKWTYNTRTRFNRREITLVSTSNKELVNFLIENDYKIKSKASPDKICKLIPNDMIKYFILGWIDADGCFYKNDKYGTSQLYLSGSFEQDWNFIEKIYESMNIKYRIQRIQGKKSKYSTIRVTNRPDIIKIGEYIYDDLIPLERKYNKFLSIRNYDTTLVLQ